MAHLNTSLPREVEIGAVRRAEWGVEVVKTDGGHEVRNQRWSAPLRSYDVSFPPMRRNNEIYLAVIQLWGDTEGGLHSFDFIDWTDETGGTVVPVRFDAPLSITGIATHLDHIDTITLVEVRL